MDGSLPPAGMETAPDRGTTPKAQSFLFLQGPISTFYDRLGRALLARGHKVHRINLHGGDRLFWRLPALNYRGRLEDWRGFVSEVLDREQITHLIVHGDRRPYHLIAAEEARARGIPIVATDLGYLRPDWITLEHDGMTSYSRFPRDPEAIREMAREFPDPDLGQRFHTSFWTIAGLDIAYNIGLVFGKALYPHYHYHSTAHPFAEYAGWLWSRTKAPRRAGTATAAREKLRQAPGSYFLVPLQLATDYQIRAHSPYDDIREAVRAVIASFAASGSPRDLVIVAHPLDNGLIDWHRFAGRIADEYGISDKVVVLGGGTPSELLCNAAGMVTINSTIGITALQNDVPVKVLGNAVFDVPGLTCQAPLEQFWHEPQRPDPELTQAFIRALAGTTQVKGGYYRPESQQFAIGGFIERLEHGLYPLAPLSADTFAERPPRASTRGVVIAGADGELGLALARQYAAPGVRLLLLGLHKSALKRAAADCLQRGALVETSDLRNLADRIDAFDEIAPIDTVIVHGGEHLLDDDITRATAIVGTAGSRMRLRGAGRVVVVSGLTGRPLPADATGTIRAHKAWSRYLTGLRRRCVSYGISLVVVSPSAKMLRLCAWLEDPGLAHVNPDRVAAQVAQSRRAWIEVTRPTAALPTIIRRLPGKLCRAARDMLLTVEDAPARAKDASLADKSGNAD